nr:hypothetical protein [Tanacetum cinerariifolium]
MEPKDTLSLCSDSDEQDMQQMIKRTKILKDLRVHSLEDKASDAISEDKAQERCMVSYRLLHSHLKLLSNNDLKGTRTEYGFKRAFATLFGQDLKTFTGIMFLNMDQLEKQLANKEFQELRSMASLEYSRHSFRCSSKFHDTLIQHIESVKKSIDKRALHKREHDSWVNERQLQTTEEKVDTSKSSDASLVDTESSGTESNEQDTSSRSGNDAHTDDANVKPIYDEKPIAEFTSQVHVNNDLPKPVTTHYLPKERESVFAKPYHMTASSESRNRSKNIPKFSSSDMVHNHYLEEAKKKTQESSRNSEPSMMPSVRSQSIANGYKPKPRINNQNSRNWWKPTGKIFKTIGLRWVPTGKIFTSSTTKVDSEPTNGSNEDIANQYEYKQTLDVSACTLNLSAELKIHDHNNEPSSSKLVLKVVTSADTSASLKQELDLLFGPLYDEFCTAGTSCVNKSSSPTDNSTQQDTPPSAIAQSTT